MWNITIVDDSMSKQFSKEKGDNVSALPATVGGLSVDTTIEQDVYSMINFKTLTISA